MRTPHFDLIVIGAGVLGSFHAYHAGKKGLKVLLLEKDFQPNEATVRNFGQVVPSGMKKGKWQQYGRRSLELYQKIQDSVDISVRKNGSVYIASDETELALINELRDINRKEGYPSYLMSQQDCLDKYPGLRADYCKGAIFFPEEITVEPRIMIHRLLAYMQEKAGLNYRPHTTVNFCQFINGKCVVEDTAGNSWTSSKVVICNGRDFRQLFPDTFYASDIIVSKLQMLITAPLHNYALKGSVLTGLSIRRYESFAECPSFQSLGAGNIEDRFKKWGIHILFKQAADGSMIIGDSHEYAPAKEQDRLGFDTKEEINKVIIDEAKRIFDLPSWEIAGYWNGYYAQSGTSDLFNQEIQPNIHVITAIGGKGMTAGPGLAEATIQQIL